MQSVKKCQVLLILFSGACFHYSPSSAARIFAVSVVPSYSHQVIFHQIYQALSLKGHQIIFVTPNPANNKNFPNVTEIDVSYIYEYSSFLEKGMKNLTYIEYMTRSRLWLEQLAKCIFEDPKIRKLYENNDENFDLVFTEYFHPIFHVFGVKFNAPVIGITTLEASFGANNAFGNPTHPFLFGNAILPFKTKMSLWTKVVYTYYYIWFYWHYYYVIHPRSDKLVREYFGQGFPSLVEAEKKTSLLIIGRSNILHGTRPQVPGVIQIGFMTSKPPKKLPKDLQTIMDEATQGVVYLSFGSNVKSSTLPRHFLRVLSMVLSDLPYLVLWKWELDSTSRQLGNNVVTRKWFPQQDILAHPNMKVFVTQGGLQSIEEAISRKVPMVGVPFIADQHMNVERLSELKIAEIIDWTTVTQDEFREAILKVAEEHGYKEKIKEIRDILIDQPMTGLEQAVWWTEYVIRHKGAKHLRSILADTPLWEYLLLDVIAVVLALVTVTSYVLYKLMSICKKKLRSYREVKVKVT